MPGELEYLDLLAREVALVEFERPDSGIAARNGTASMAIDHPPA